MKKLFVVLLLLSILFLLCDPITEVQNFTGCFGGVEKEEDLYYVYIDNVKYDITAEIYLSLSLFAKKGAKVQYIEYSDGSLKVYEVNGTCT